MYDGKLDMRLNNGNNRTGDGHDTHTQKLKSYGYLRHIVGRISASTGDKMSRINRSLSDEKNRNKYAYTSYRLTLLHGRPFLMIHVIPLLQLTPTPYLDQPDQSLL